MFSLLVVHLSLFIFSLLFLSSFIHVYMHKYSLGTRGAEQKQKKKKKRLNNTYLDLSLTKIVMSILLLFLCLICLSFFFIHKHSLIIYASRICCKIAWNCSIWFLFFLFFFPFKMKIYYKRNKYDEWFDVISFNHYRILSASKFYSSKKIKPRLQLKVKHWGI